MRDRLAAYRGSDNVQPPSGAYLLRGARPFHLPGRHRRSLDPGQLAYLVSALRNHAPRADRAFLDTATAALLARGDLLQHHAAAIEALRRRYLE